MKLCSRCKKRVAVVFMTRMDGNETINEGLCIRCAKELGIGPVNDMLAKMGISDDDLARMDDDMESFVAMMGGASPEMEDDDAPMLPDFAPQDADADDESDEGRAPAVDFGSMLNNLFNRGKREDADKTAHEEPRPKKKKKAKFLDSYCVNLTARARDGQLDSVIGRDREIARLIHLTATQFETKKDYIRDCVKTLCDKYPLY